MSEECKPLPTNNARFGFWGSCQLHNIPVSIAWNVASELVTAKYKLTPEETREVLDGRSGRILVDLMINASTRKIESEEEIRKTVGAALGTEDLTFYVEAIKQEMKAGKGSNSPTCG